MTKNRQITALRVALSVAVASAGVTDVALAAKHHGGKGARKKKSSRRTIFVRCATVSVRCQGTTGAPGPKGPNGPAGPNGPRGVKVIARPVSMQPLTTSVSNRPDPLTNNHWVQGAADDERLLGAVTLTAPAKCNGSPNGGFVAVSTFLDGALTGFTVITGSAGKTETDSLSFKQNGSLGGNNDGDVMADGVAHDHVLTTRVSDNCGTAGDGHYVIQKLGYAVASFG